VILTQVLAIIRLSLELAIEMLKSMPEAEKADFLKRHNERMEFWHGLVTKFDGQ
jgi:hypothetical protein